jgi:putative restriction endonuclease
VATSAYVLPAWHRQALDWFQANAGRTFAQRPFRVPGVQVNLTNPRAGIWKPGASIYALSVIQTPAGVYADQDPTKYPDEGTWRYYYHQQGKTEAEIRGTKPLYTNKALLKCREDNVPVGVIIPGASGVGYEVLGLAYVNEFEAPYFELVGPVSLDGVSADAMAEASAALTVAMLGTDVDVFDPHATQDNRLTVIREVHRRQGGPRFRRALLSAYEERCAVTRYSAAPALEAAHIVPYRGPQTNHVANGLLLRADVHDLFDLGLVAVDTDSMTLLIGNDLAGTEYEKYAGAKLWVPRDPDARPSVDALAIHRENSQVA